MIKPFLKHTLALCDFWSLFYCAVQSRISLHIPGIYDRIFVSDSRVAGLVRTKKKGVRPLIFGNIFDLYPSGVIKRT